jgi:MATE family multidrug resistance protein
MSVRTEARETMRLALPIAFGQVALMAMNLVDAALVGHVSQAELAVVSLGNALSFAILCPALGVTMAIEPLTAQAVGAGDVARAWDTVRAGTIACLLLAAPTALVTWASARALGLCGVEADLLPGVERYVLARLLGLPAYLLFTSGKAFLEARGLVRPLWVGGWAANVLNFVWSSLLVFGDRALERVGLPPLGLPALGSFGAGLATSASNVALAAIVWAAIWRARPEGARLFAGLRGLAPAARKALALGTPIGLQVFTEVGIFSLATVLAGRLGATTAAAHQIALGVASFSYMGVLGLANATAVRVGRAVGAREFGGPRRAGLVGLGLTTSYMVGCALILVAGRRLVASLFSPDPDVIEAASHLLLIAALFQIADGAQGVMSGALRGAADSRFASIANLVCHWGFGLPVAYALAFFAGWGAPGIWWGLLAGLVAVSVALVRRFWTLTSRHIEAVLPRARAPRAPAGPRGAGPNAGRRGALQRDLARVSLRALAAQRNGRGDGRRHGQGLHRRIFGRQGRQRRVELRLDADDALNVAGDIAGVAERGRESGVELLRRGRLFGRRLGVGGGVGEGGDDDERLFLLVTTGLLRRRPDVERLADADLGRAQRLDAVVQVRRPGAFGGRDVRAGFAGGRLDEVPPKDAAGVQSAAGGLGVIDARAIVREPRRRGHRGRARARDWGGGAAGRLGVLAARGLVAPGTTPTHRRCDQPARHHHPRRQSPERHGRFLRSPCWPDLAFRLSR